MTKKSKYKKGSYNSFKKMTLDIVTGKIKANKTIKKWISDPYSDGLIQFLRNVFIRSPKSPRSAEMHVWNRIEKAQRKNHPIAYFLLYDVVTYVSVKKRRIGDFIWWFKYRLQKEHRYHIVDTKLSPGYYSEADILLHSSMSVLVDYVETHYHGADEPGAVGLRNYITFLEGNLDPKSWPEWERKYGAKYKRQKIESEMKYVVAYRDILMLYNWWKFQRDVEHLSMEQEKNMFWDTRKFKAGFDMESTDAPVDPAKLSLKEKRLYNKEIRDSIDLHTREDALNDKDDEMLARLAKVRKYLW
jgi:hypothetical protein